jgi:hypothetical protein
VYAFSWTSAPTSNAVRDIHLDTAIVVNGEVKVRATSGYPSGWNSGNNQVALLLEVGDLVWIRALHGDYLYGSAYSSFSGWSI